MTVQINATEQYFLVALILMLQRLTESVDEVLGFKGDHLKKELLSSLLFYTRCSEILRSYEILDCIHSSIKRF